MKKNNTRKSGNYKKNDDADEERGLTESQARSDNIKKVDLLEASVSQIKHMTQGKQMLVILNRYKSTY